MPANDNIPLKPPKPANDNDLERLRRLGVEFGRRTRPFRRVARRVHPAFRVGDLVIEGLANWASVNARNIRAFELPGGTHVGNCRSGPHNWQGIHGPITQCTGFQAGGLPLGTPVTVLSTQRFVIANRYPVAGGFRYDPIDAYSVPANGTYQAVRAVAYSPAVQPLPAMRPEPEFGYGYQASMARSPLQRGRIDLKPYEVPATEVWADFHLRPDGSIQVTTGVRPQSSHKNLPPTGREKEEKFRGRAGAVHAFMARYGMMPSEWIEFVDAFYEALPAEYQTARSGWEKIQAVYNHLGKLNPLDVLENIAVNIVEDAVIGRVQRQIDKWGTAAYGGDARQWHLDKGRITNAQRLLEQ